MLQDNTQTALTQVDLMAIDALFKRIAERGHKVRAQAVDDKALAPELQKDMPPEKGNQCKKRSGK